MRNISKLISPNYSKHQVFGRGPTTTANWLDRYCYWYWYWNYCWYCLRYWSWVDSWRTPWKVDCSHCCNRKCYYQNIVTRGFIPDTLIHKVTFILSITTPSLKQRRALKLYFSHSGKNQKIGPGREYQKVSSITVALVLHVHSHCFLPLRFQMYRIQRQRLLRNSWWSYWRSYWMPWWSWELRWQWCRRLLTFIRRNLVEMSHMFSVTRFVQITTTG